MWQWVTQLWRRVSGLGAPPHTPEVLLAGDRRHWQPSSAGQQLMVLWDVMRVATIHFLWLAREDGPSPASARGVAARLVAFLRRRVAEDVVRVREWRRVRGVLGVAHMCDRPLLSDDVFVSRWCRGGLLCVAVGSSYHTRLTTFHPVPIP